jgi:hypothetical protein
VTPGAVVICGGAASFTNVSAFTSSDLSNFRTGTNTSGTQDHVCGMGSFEWTSGAFDAAQWGGGNTSTSASWCACSMALRPAP